MVKHLSSKLRFRKTRVHSLSYKKHESGTCIFCRTPRWECKVPYAILSHCISVSQFPMCKMGDNSKEVSQGLRDAQMLKKERPYVFLK